MKRQLLFAFKFLTITSVYLFTRSRTPANKLKFPEKSLAVLFLLQNLKRIFVYNARLIKDSQNQVEILESDIRLFKAFLKDYAKRANTNGDVDELVAEIQDVVFEAEDVIASALNQEAENRARNFFQNAFGGQMKRVGIAKEVMTMRAKVKSIYDKRRDFIYHPKDRRSGA